MKWIVLIILLPITISNQSLAKGPKDPEISLYLLAFYNTDGKSIYSGSKIEDYLDRLSEREREFKNRRAFLEYIFNKTHQRFLKHYDLSAAFSDIFKSGNYNCLTATALYSLILKEFDFEYEIVETNYHIFILVSLEGDDQVLIETTDHVNGFTTGKNEIEDRIAEFVHNNNGSVAGSFKNTYSYKNSLYNTIDLNGVLALLHFNLSVQAYNNREFEQSVFHLKKATEMYQSSRIVEFYVVLLNSISTANIHAAKKNELISKCRAIKADALVFSSLR